MKTKKLNIFLISIMILNNNYQNNRNNKKSFLSKKNLMIVSSALISTIILGTLIYKIYYSKASTSSKPTLKTNSITNPTEAPNTQYNSINNTDDQTPNQIKPAISTKSPDNTINANNCQTEALKTPSPEIIQKTSKKIADNLPTKSDFLNIDYDLEINTFQTPSPEIIQEISKKIADNLPTKSELINSLYKEIYNIDGDLQTNTFQTPSPEIIQEISEKAKIIFTHLQEIYREKIAHHVPTKSDFLNSLNKKKYNIDDDLEINTFQTPSPEIIQEISKKIADALPTKSDLLNSLYKEIYNIDGDLQINTFQTPSPEIIQEISEKAEIIFTHLQEIYRERIEPHLPTKA
jgi:hypothetical protein